jgi:hypothetical protein
MYVDFSPLLQGSISIGLEIRFIENSSPIYKRLRIVCPSTGKEEWLNYNSNVP